MDLLNDTMIHIKENGIEYLQFKKLLEYKDKISHCYTLKGSKNDYMENKDNNYELLYKSLNLPYDGFTQVKHQVHGDKIENVLDKNEEHVNIDGLLTNKKGISLSLRYADCTPILFYDPVKNVIGNVHSGWRGTVQKIGQKGFLKMIDDYECNPKDILCFIAPSIGKCHFEVGQDVKEIFVETFSYLLKEEEYVKIGEYKEEQKYYIDTNIINEKLLEEAGALKENIFQSNICTVCNSDNMHSYRKEKENSGRNTAIIGLK